MISDEFETFGDNHFGRGQTKTKIFVQKIIHFIKIQNDLSKHNFFFNPEYSFKGIIHFSKEAVSARAKIS